MFYFVNLLILLVYSKLFKYFNINRKFFLIFSAVHIGGIMAFRSCYTGTDTYQYYNAYKMLISFKGNILDLAKMYSKFPGWAVLFKAISYIFGANPNFYMFATGYFIVIITWIAISLFDIDQMQAVLLYYLLFALQAMNVARQNMALCMVFLSAALFIKGKKKIAVILLPLAISLHISAVIGILIIFVFAVKWTRKRVYCAIALSVLGLLSVNILFNLFTSSFSGYSSYLLGVFKASGRNVVMQVAYILTFFYAMWIQKSHVLDNNKEQILLKNSVLLWGEILLGVCFSTEIFIVRENLYLQIFIILLFPIVICYANRYRKVYKLVVYGLALFYFSYRIYSNYGGIMPYQTYLFKN